MLKTSFCGSPCLAGGSTTTLSHRRLTRTAVGDIPQYPLFCRGTEQNGSAHRATKLGGVRAARMCVRVIRCRFPDYARCFGPLVRTKSTSVHQSHPAQGHRGGSLRLTPFATHWQHTIIDGKCSRRLDTWASIEYVSLEHSMNIRSGTTLATEPARASFVERAASMDATN
jgi:hypothetical protein